MLNKNTRWLSLFSAAALALGACDAADLSDDAALAQTSSALTHDPSDTSFNTSGRAYGPDNSTYATDFVEVDGKLYYSATFLQYDHWPSPAVTGWIDVPYNAGMVIGRMTGDGAIDTSFAWNGVWTVGFPLPAGQSASTRRFQAANAILFDGTGLVIGGTSDGHFALTRLLRNAATDTRFGNSAGTIETDFAGATGETIDDLALDSRGNIVAAGSALVGSTRRVAIARYLPNGTPDPTFNAGKVLWNDAAAPSVGGRVSLALEGDVPVVAFHTADKKNFVARFSVAGRLDRTFGQPDVNGVRSGFTQIGATNDATVVGALLVRASRGHNTIYVSGNDAAHHVALWSLLTNGEVDTTFGEIDDNGYRHGVVTTDYAGTTETITAMTFDPVVQRLYLGGSSEGNYILAAYLPGGDLDTSFSDGGKLRTDFLAASREKPFAMITDNDRLFVAGDSYTNGHARASFAKYVIATGQPGEPCRNGLECDGSMRCGEGHAPQGAFTECFSPVSGSLPVGGGTPSNPLGCPGKGEECTTHPSGCMTGFQAPGIITCSPTGAAVCTSKPGQDWCGLGGSCSAAATCGSNADCAPGDTCLIIGGNPGTCNPGCPVASNFCYLPNEGGQCEAEPPNPSAGE